MNFLNNKSLYLCGAIKSVSDDGTTWRNNISEILIKKYNINILNPCNKVSSTDVSEIGADKEKFKNIIIQENWKQLKEEFWPVVRHDLRSIDKADFIIFNYDPEVSTVGSIHELVVANFEKKPILLKYDKKKLETFNPWLCVFIKEQHFFSQWSQMISYLDQLNTGKVDSSYWI